MMAKPKASRKAMLNKKPNRCTLYRSHNIYKVTARAETGKNENKAKSAQWPK